MLFKKEMIEQILAGKKTMTRRLVKETEAIGLDVEGVIKVESWEKWNQDKLMWHGKSRIKWQVGKKYAVCPGRAKKKIEYCPKCRTICHDTFALTRAPYRVIEKTTGLCYDCRNEIIPLFIELVEIKKEKLSDITKTDSIKEGFNSRSEFMHKFFQINKKPLPNISSWNPNVWVLTFKVVE
jgi:hypothetical protein